MIAKVILIVDLLPLARAFGNRPLIVPAAWRTLIYVAVAVLFVYLEHIIPLVLLRHHSLAEAHRIMFLDVVWSRFLALLIWLAVLFFLFAAGQELSRAIGKGQLRHLFIGR
jgi:hypothetical protein